MSVTAFVLTAAGGGLIGFLAGTLYSDSRVNALTREVKQLELDVFDLNSAKDQVTIRHKTCLDDLTATTGELAGVRVQLETAIDRIAAMKPLYAWATERRAAYDKTNLLKKTRRLAAKQAAQPKPASLRKGRK